MTRRVALFAVSALAALLVSPMATLAHIGGEPSIIVPLDHADPGRPLPVIAADLGADAMVTFTLSATDHDPLRLGTSTAGPDGHFQATFNLPADFPLGYAQLVASSDDGSQASTWILVGPRTESTPAAPNKPELWQDPAVMLISFALAIGGIALAWTTIRASRRERAMAATLEASSRRPRPRKPRKC